jgi:MFS family permease
VVSAVALSLLINLFPEPGERAKAMGVYGFVCAGGGSIGVLLGGLLTSLWSWHWVFLVNLPLGVAVAALTRALVPAGARSAASGWTGRRGDRHAVADAGRLRGGRRQQRRLGLAQTLVAAGRGGAAARRVHRDRVARGRAADAAGLFRHRNLAVANVAGVLWAAAMFAWFFMSALYMQLVLGWGPMQVGLAFLPANLVMAALSLGASARIVMRFGIRGPLAGGLAVAAPGLACSPRAGRRHFAVDVLPAMLLLGLGAGVAFNPMLLAAMGDVDPGRRRAGVGHREHRLHDGRRARPGGAGQRSAAARTSRGSSTPRASSATPSTPRSWPTRG